MRETRLEAAPPFHFRDVVFSHGWLRLPPYEWDEGAGILRRLDAASGGVVRTELSAADGGVLVRSEDDPGAASARVRWILALDDDLSGFHARCAGEPRLREAAERGRGRVLRCPSVWEDLVKTLLSVNTTWRQTIAMTRNMVGLHGPEHAEGGRAFPTVAAVAAVDPAALQVQCRVGYRAKILSHVAREVDSGRLDLEGLKDAGAEEAEERLLAIRGVGPYAAANILLLLGHYDHLPVDSWFRKTVRDAWFGGEAVPDRTLTAAFERFRPYRALAYFFYDWKGAQRREILDRVDG